jgi:hypothetical protein
MNPNRGQCPENRDCATANGAPVASHASGPALVTSSSSIGLAVQAARRISPMSIVDDLVENLIERNVIRLNGTFTISLVAGGVAVKGQVQSVLRDQKKNKDVLNINAPIDAEATVSEIVIPLPQIR